MSRLESHFVCSKCIERYRGSFPSDCRGRIWLRRVKVDGNLSEDAPFVGVTPTESGVGGGISSDFTEEDGVRKTIQNFADLRCIRPALATEWTGGVRLWVLGWLSAVNVPYSGHEQVGLLEMADEGPMLNV